MMVSYAQNYEDVILARVFRDRSDGFYVDVGAMDPVADSITKHFYDRGWHGINVEPNPHFYAKLANERPRDVNLPYCVSDEEGILTFHVFEDQGVSTLQPHVAEHFAGMQFPYRTINAPVRTLASVMAHAPLEIDFLKIDVEGWELPVIRSNDWSRYRPIVVLIEALDPTTLAPCWEGWDPELTRHGYVFVYFDGLNRFYLREDRQDLRHFFATPLNVFDNFQPASHAELTHLTTELESEQARLHGVIDTLKQDASAQHHALKSQIQLTAELQSRQEALIENRERLRMQVDHLQTEANKQHQILTSLQLTNTRLLQQCKEQRSESQLLQAELEDLKHQCAQHDNEIERIRSDYLNQRLWVGQLAQDKAAAIIRIRELTEELSKCRQS